MTKLWGGRFSGSMDALMAEFQNSISFDVRLWDVDIQGSVAYAHALAQAGIITADEAERLVNGLQQVHAEFAGGNFATKPDDEDIHTAVERRLRELAGEVAGKLHTGRSRNDQIATDTRLFTLQAITQIKTLIMSLQEELVGQARQHADTLMPGYTHLQRAQPITFAHWCMAYFWMLTRDIERLADCARRTSTLPLGSGALAGNPFAIDRTELAKELGFAAVSDNSLDGVSDRDFIAEMLFCTAMAGIHLSRMAEDLVIYSSSEYGFVSFDDAYSTGSSLMPQKKNPDAMELARGKSARLTGNLVTLLTLIKGLPMTYNKDLQEDKEPLFDSIDTISLTLQVVTGAVHTLRINADRMAGALDPAMLATDVAEYLVRKGVPFRTAHHLSGRAVALCERRSVALSQLSLEDWRSISTDFGPDIQQVFDFARSVASRDVKGGTSPRALREQLQQAHDWLTQHQTHTS
ncbi:MAG: argininosuccinate lyase [Chloroflexi bacterium]|nr:argininosuccinate lyase [Chloroflexota bacterium]MCL5273824.1 argininosuccinate lyase [Chloroflexota bacterium]